MRRVHPDAIFLDTSTVVCALESAIPHHRACREFRDQRLRDGTRVIISQILRIEFAQTWYRLPATTYLGPKVVRDFRLGAWDRDPAVRETWMVHGISLLDRFLDRFAATLEVPLDISLISASVRLMARYRLKSHDAIHVATALAAGVPDFASVDSDFRRVPALRLHLLRDADD